MILACLILAKARQFAKISSRQNYPLYGILKLAGKGQHATLKRSLRLLYPLEVMAQPDTVPSLPTRDTNRPASESDEDNTEPSPRPRRKAADKARQAVRRLLEDSDLED